MVLGLIEGLTDALPLTDGSQRFGGVLENQLVKEGNS
jgi:hypothetical protein